MDVVKVLRSYNAGHDAGRLQLKYRKMRGGDFPFLRATCTLRTSAATRPTLVQGKGRPDGHYLLDLKQSRPSSLRPHLPVKQPRWMSEAHRMVEVQRRVQAVSAAFLHPVRMNEQPWVLRELQPSEDELTLGGSNQKRSELSQMVATMARVVAWSHLRSAGREGSVTADELIDYGQRSKWRQKLLDASNDCAAQVRRDAAAFNAAYDAGAFAT